MANCLIRVNLPWRWSTWWALPEKAQGHPGALNSRPALWGKAGMLVTACARLVPSAAL